jgi:hypothetical protein
MREVDQIRMQTKVEAQALGSALEPFLGFCALHKENTLPDSIRISPYEVFQARRQERLRADLAAVRGTHSQR